MFGPRRLAFVFLFVAILIWIGLSDLNHYRLDGQVRLPGLSASAQILRDEKGIPYLYAANLTDAFRLQGYAMAKDRLFQMTLNRLFAQGRISELAGEATLALDQRQRALGFHHQAKKHVQILEAREQALFTAFVEGINHYVQTSEEEWGLEFRLAGIRPELWRVEDVFSIIYYMGWGSAGNLRHELLALALAQKLTPGQLQSLWPVNFNPRAGEAQIPPFQPQAQAETRPQAWLALADQLEAGKAGFEVGINNWAVTGSKTKSGLPILANDPHLDARLLPGVFWPVGVVLPDRRVLGVAVPGIPGPIIGRNDRLAVGMTNSYGDAQDLYWETPDPAQPGNYLQGEQSLPFLLRQESIKVKDKKSPGGYKEVAFLVRSTQRGPLLNGLLPDLPPEPLVSVRWAPFETMGPRIGMDYLYQAQDVNSLRQILRDLTVIHINYVFADQDNRVGWQTSGRLPLRTRGDGTNPVHPQAQDNWQGWIPYEQMLQDQKEGQGWLGTANHNAAPPGYPHYVSSYFSAPYRQQRMMQLLEPLQGSVALDHWAFQRDEVNLLALDLLPRLLPMIQDQPGLQAFHQLLANWDGKDGQDSAAALAFQRWMVALVRASYQDELGLELTNRLLRNHAFWQGRFQALVQAGESPWFDQVQTPNRESLTDLARQAAQQAKQELESTYGKDPQAWRWGTWHQVEFVHPLRRSGWGKGLLGAERFAMGGSVESLYRAMYHQDQQGDVTVTASLRLVADLGDQDKIMAVLPGGVTDRAWHPFHKNQLADFMSGKPVYWWFSEAEIQKHQQYKMVILP